MALASLACSASADSPLPAALPPSFLGGRPPVWQGHRSLFDKGSPHGGGHLLHAYRNEAAIRVAAQMPPYPYGCTPYAARPDVVAAGGVGDWGRMLRQKRTACSWIAPAQRAQTDAFYMLCQQHRDQLRDHSARLHPLDFFDIAPRPFHCPVDLFTTYQRYPVAFTKYRQPQAQALSFGRTIAIPALPARSLVGDHGQGSHTQWKGQSKAMFT